MMIQEVHFVGKNEVHLYPAVLAIIGVFCLLIPNDSQPWKNCKELNNKVQLLKGL